MSSMGQKPKQIATTTSIHILIQKTIIQLKISKTSTFQLIRIEMKNNPIQLNIRPKSQTKRSNHNFYHHYLILPSY